MKQLFNEFMGRLISLMKPHVSEERLELPYDGNAQCGNKEEEGQLDDDNQDLQVDFPAGHYYSTIPSREDIIEFVKHRRPPESELPDIQLNAKSQYRLLEEYTELYQDLPFHEEQVPGLRYYYNNVWFSYSDAIFLYCFLRKYQPRRIIEVGSGYSSAVMLDTIDRCFSQRPELTFIEPNPERLISLLGEGDRERVRLFDCKIQEVPANIFYELESGDFLFIDSSHVVKCGSDLHFLLFDVMPYLKPGVFVHFHDIFYPFEYPSSWLKRGYYWNENYFLRAFLANNSQWTIVFFNTYVHHMFGDLIKDKMPLCANNIGGSLYIQRQL